MNRPYPAQKQRFAAEHGRSPDQHPPKPSAATVGGRAPFKREATAPGVASSSRHACGVRLQVLSDLHLERGGGPPPIADADVLVLAGDIGPGVAGLQAAALVARRPIIYVSGNHEPYGHGLPNLTGQLRTAATAFERPRARARA